MVLGRSRSSAEEAVKEKTVGRQGRILLGKVMAVTNAAGRQ
jgi:hypothetical protein